MKVFHQKFSTHIVSFAKSEANGVIGKYVNLGLMTVQTENMLKAGQNRTYIAHMPINAQAGGSGKQSKSHAEKVKDSENTGSEVDIRVLSEVTGTKVVILTAGKDGKLAKMQEMNPKTKDASQTVTLVYRPKSDQHPDGHYDVLINNKTVSVEKADLYHAVARGMKPDSSDDDITSAATDLRTKEAEALEKNPSLWEPFLLRDEWIKEVITASSFTAEGAAESQDSVKQNKKHFQNIMKEESEKVKEQSNAKDKDGTQKISNGHNQPSKKSILTAGHFNKDSKLSKLMFEVATGSSDHAKCQLPVVYAPHERHHKFPTAESPELKTLLAQTISKDDVEGTFKLTILGAMPTFMLERKHFLNEDMSLTRLDSFKSTFPKHATEMVNTWFKLLEGKTDLMTPDTKQTLEDWISSKGYLDPNDPARKQIMTHL
ncbi:uncharacterized protein LOC133131644 isoform X3 [Conger conger]|uniref:uncharacterized protein LOC133131644 isoform X3 n=1 Tax=Conger conger TaxID=82655 RepID=UPI002A59E3E0|nr:uncharacterized protein LOC133131644 isoform X3 [Conger conger]